MDKPVIFFDGYCILCNGLVDFLLKRDRKNIFYFASLQGETAHTILTEKQRTQTDSVILLADNNVAFESEAIIKIISGLGGFWGLFKIAKIFPRRFSDNCYRFIARHRYNWFGKKDQCRVPLPNERNRILP